MLRRGAGRADLRDFRRSSPRSASIRARSRVRRDVGATGVQGFLHLRPVSAVDFEVWLEARARPGAPVELDPEFQP